MLLEYGQYVTNYLGCHGDKGKRPSTVSLCIVAGFVTLAHVVPLYGSVLSRRPPNFRLTFPLSKY